MYLVSPSHGVPGLTELLPHREETSDERASERERERKRTIRFFGQQINHERGRHCVFSGARAPQIRLRSAIRRRRCRSACLVVATTHTPVFLSGNPLSERGEGALAKRDLPPSLRKTTLQKAPCSSHGMIPSLDMGREGEGSDPRPALASGLLIAQKTRNTTHPSITG